MKFGPGPVKLANLRPWSEDLIRQMPMLYRADLGFALKHVPRLQEFVHKLPLEALRRDLYQSLDIKVLMLKPGWYPCIPGWHLDDFYRPGGGQPDIANLAENSSKHFMALFGDCSLTGFLKGWYEFPLPPVGRKVYGYYNELIENSITVEQIIQPNVLYSFTSLDFHRGRRAFSSGWRAFVRLTVGRVREPKNEIRRQAQVYVPVDKITEGW